MADQTLAREAIEDFQQRFGQAHLDLAYHAALPLALTPDLLYHIWANFQRDVAGNLLHIPWIAVADLLLSPLCREIRYETYSMEDPVRDLLLQQMQQNPRFQANDKSRLVELAEFLRQYVARDLDSPQRSKQELAHGQQLAAFAYTQPERLVQALAEAYAQLQPTDRSQFLRLAALAQTFAEPLSTWAKPADEIHIEFETLQQYGRSMVNLAKGNLPVVSESIAPLRSRLNASGQVTISGITLSLPTQLVTPSFNLPSEPPPVNNVFISYTHQDLAFVIQLHQELTSQGISAWFYKENSEVADTLSTSLVEGIRDCKVFVLVLSPDSVISKTIHRQIDLAQRYNKQIVPLSWRDTERPTIMRYLLAGMQWISFNETASAENFNAMVNVLDRLISNASPGETITDRSIAEEPTTPAMASEPPQTNDVFISYAHQDLAFVTQLCQELMNRGISAWFNKENIEIDDQRAISIVEGIRDCKVFVLVLSPDSAASKSIGRQVDFAEQCNRRIVPLIWRHTKLTVALEYQLAGLQITDFKDTASTENFNDIAEVINRLLGRPTIPQEPSSKPTIQAVDIKDNQAASSRAFDTGAIRSMLTDMFPDAEDFEFFRYEYFRDVEFAEDMSLKRKAHVLTQYCAQNNRLDELLNLVETYHPAKYAQWKNTLYLEETPPVASEPAAEPQGQDVFISYSPKNIDFVQYLYQQLTSQGLSVWYDEQGIETATQWRESVVTGITNCKVFLPVLSPESVASVNFRKELDLAEHRKKKIFPLMWREVNPLPPSFQYQLEGIQYIDFKGAPSEENFKKVHRIVARVLDGVAVWKAASGEPIIQAPGITDKSAASSRAYDTGAIRNFLTEIFSDPDEIELFRDIFFKQVQFADDMALKKRAHVLTQYCAQNDRLDELLNLVEKHYPNQYAVWKDRIYLEETPPVAQKQPAESQGQDIFISYSTKNLDFVQQLYQQLTSRGLSVWYDKQGIEGATQWRESTVAGIMNCKVFLLVLSPEAAASDNIRKELDLAEHHKKKIFSAIWRDTDPLPPSFQYQLAGTESVSFNEVPSEENFNKVFHMVDRLLERSAVPEVTVPEPAAEPQGQDVFISYSTKNMDFVQQLYQQLTSRGLSVWFDKQSIEGATQWRASIISGIMNCKVFLLVLSPESAASDNIRKELDLADHHRKKILPLMWREVNPLPPSFQYQMAGTQYISFNGIPSEENFSKVFHIINRLLGGASVSEAASGEAAIQAPGYAAVQSSNQPVQPSSRRPERGRERGAAQEINAVVTGAMVMIKLVNNLSVFATDEKDIISRELDWVFQAAEHFLRVRQGERDRTTPVPVPIPPDAKVEPGANNTILNSHDDFTLGMLATQVQAVIKQINQYMRSLAIELDKEAQLGGAAGANIALMNSIRSQQLAVAKDTEELAGIMHTIYGVLVYGPEDITKQLA